jgi:hypothetical protein
MSNNEIQERILKTSINDLMVLLEISIVLETPSLEEAIEHYISLIK